MNTRKIRLALTIGLINSGIQSNALQAIKELMSSLKEDVGAFLGLKPVGSNPINQDSVKEQYTFRFENCTLNVDLINNRRAHIQTIQGFQLA